MYQAAEYHNITIDDTTYLVKHKYAKDDDGNETYETHLVAENGATYILEPVYEETADGETRDTGYRTLRPLNRSDSRLRDVHGKVVKLFQVGDMLDHVGHFNEY